uniref:UPAR/Ly6 domain-containing protein n=1 Tax=Dicentrarchus labrax TaxID=13489 RepID=A0A8C4GP85_DICLA
MNTLTVFVSPGLSLLCYSCPEGSTESCEVQQECSQGEDSCLKLTSDCDFRTLGSRYYRLSSFTFSCCQSKLCNGPKKSGIGQTLKELLG